MAAESHTSEDCCRGRPAARANAVLELLRARGLRVTRARRALVEALARARLPLSADQLHQALPADAADLVTVYRNLESLEQAGVVQQHPLDRNRALYSLVATGHHHHHLVCRNCGQIERLGDCDSGAIEAGALARGFTALTHVLEIHGLCPRCSHG